MLAHRVVQFTAGRRKAFFCDSLDKGNYNPKIYIPSKWKPPPASKEVEQRLNEFESELKKLKQRSMQQPKCSNLTHQQWAIRNELKRSDKYVTFAADKNLGVALIEREEYERRVWSDHLSDATTYKIIDPRHVRAKEWQMQYKIDDFLFELRDKKHARPENKLIFFSRLKDERVLQQAL